MRCTMKRTFLALSILILLTFISKACENTTVSAIAADSHKFDDKEVCVEGSVSDPYLSSRTGNNYTTFGLNDDNGKSLSVYFLGTLSIKEGDKVKVTGRYEVKKIVLKDTLYNEIDAISVEKLQ
jgi:hypothetical protein